MSQDPSSETVSLITLGCKVNQYETQSFRESFVGAGRTEVDERAGADLTVVNACVVTRTAEKESLAKVRRALRRNPTGRVIATGCLSDRAKEALAGLERVSIVSALAKNQVPFAGGVSGEAPPPSSVSGMAITGFKGRTRAFVKVQDGCALSCSFCIIPKVRGHLRSRKIADIRAEVEGLAAAGVREVVLTGVHLGHFGRGKGERERLHQLLMELERVEGIARIRLSSIESVELKPELLAVLSGSAKFCPHFHLPLQAGSDRILERMRRRYSLADFMAGVEELWRRFEAPSISTDLIVGFPGESEAEFEQTLATMRAAGFSRTHVFSYSDREGTDATAMADKVSPAEIKRRTAEAIRLGERLAARYARLFLGEELEVLIESRGEDGRGRGYSRRYLRVAGAAPEDAPGTIRRGRLVAVGDDGLGLVDFAAAMTVP